MAKQAKHDETNPLAHDTVLMTEIERIQGLEAGQDTLLGMIEELQSQVKELSEKLEKLGDPTKVDRRGRPRSQRDMTDEDARAIMIGQYREVSHKTAAEQMGLSYGQVYSARLGFTFKHIRKEMLDGGLKDIWNK